MAGMPILLLTTTGRKSGKRRTVPLGYLEEGPNVVVIGSYGGHERDPGWIHNLRGNPLATIQLKRAHISVVAEPVESLERARLWAKLIESAPIYEGYRKRTARQIPLMILKPQS